MGKVWAGGLPSLAALHLLVAILLPSIALGSARAMAAQAAASFLVLDQTTPALWFLRDLDGDGVFSSASEVRLFYRGPSGSVPLAMPATLHVGVNGAVYVGDSGLDRIVRFFDVNGDGDAADSGEAQVYFDGSPGNPSGLELRVINGLWVDLDDTVWVAAADTAFGGQDVIARLRDGNGDGDANDPGEQQIFYAPLSSPSLGSIPMGLLRGADGVIRYMENGFVSIAFKIMFTLNDLNHSGSITGNEVQQFFTGVFSTTGFYSSLVQDREGYDFLHRISDGSTIRFRNADFQGPVAPADVDEVHSAPAARSQIWSLAVGADDRLHALEDSAPDRLLRFVDHDGDGLFMGPNEVEEIDSDLTAAVDIGSPRAMFAYPAYRPPVGRDYCRAITVPNSTSVPGHLRADGSVSISTDDLQIHASDLPTSSLGLFLVSQQTGLFLHPSGSLGNLCLGGTIGRYVHDEFDTGPSAMATLQIDLHSVPGSNGPLILPPGSSLVFQAWYRDAQPTAVSNFTDAVSLTLRP